MARCIFEADIIPGELSKFEGSIFQWIFFGDGTAWVWDRVLNKVCSQDICWRAEDGRVWFKNGSEVHYTPAPWPQVQQAYERYINNLMLEE